MHVSIGNYSPDKRHTFAPDVRYIMNMLPTSDGYSTIPGAIATPIDALTEKIRGAYQGVWQNGTQFIVAAHGTSLWLATTTTWTDVTRGAGTPAYNLAASDRWEMCQYGNYVFATHINDDVQYYLSGSSTDFAQVSADCSRAKVIATVGEHIVLGNIIGQGTNSGIGTQIAGLHWGAIGAPLTWPAVGTAAAVSVESDYQILDGEGGAITNIVPTSEFTLVLRERSVWRMDYVGSPAVFSFRKIDNQRGCHIQGAAVAVGGKVYFPSRDGFMVCDGFSVQQVGYEVVDETWTDFAALSEDHQVSVAHVPAWKSVGWAMPNQEGKTPNQIWFYNYVLNKWWRLEARCDWILKLLPYGISLDDAPYATMSMDATAPTGLGDVRIDDLTGSTQEILGFFDSSSWKIKTFTNTSSYLNGNLEMFDFVAGEDAQQRFLVRYMRPWYEGTGTIRCDYLTRLSPTQPDSNPYFTTHNLNAYGVIPIRKSGRYHRPYFILAGEITRFSGFDAEVSMEGSR